MKVLVFGLGQFGMFLAEHFVSSGFEVFGWDINESKAMALEALGAKWGSGFETDLVILALFPEQITSAVLKALSPDALLINVSSVQQPGLAALNRSQAGANKDKVFSFHALFGPVGVNGSGWAGKQLVVTVEPKKDNRFSALLETFARKGVLIDEMSPEEHDNKMLTHALAFLVAELVKVGARDADPRYLTGSGRQLLGLLDFTEAASPELRRLILSNPELKTIAPKLTETLSELSKQYGW